jgi:hypothetical protein
MAILNIISKFFDENKSEIRQYLRTIILMSNIFEGQEARGKRQRAIAYWVNAFL